VRAPDRGYAADVDAILAQVTARTRIVILANPNNPTGTYIRARELARLRAGLRSDILLIIDAAYAEYVEGADFSAGSDVVEATANTAMTRTFSKIHGLASLRIGWCYAHPDIIGVVGRIRSPFNISTAAQAAGVAALADVAWQESVVAHTRRWRDALTRKLQSYDLEVTGTEANFVNCGFPEAGPKSAAAVDAGLRERGISVRPMAGFGLPHHLRITIGTEREMHDVIAALDEILGGAGAA
jgi:histidinol-phosphate aminotransferase